MLSKRIRVLIWGKTYPELSDRYVETVCTGGVREDGRPVRLYPVPFRYLASDAQYRTYDWVEADVEQSTRDPRPESLRITSDSLVCIGHVEAGADWRARGESVFRFPGWQMESVDALISAQAGTGQSLGVVTPGEIVDVRAVARTSAERAAFQQKAATISGTDDMFRDEFKPLTYPDADIKLRFRCRGACRCKEPGHGPHDMKILDWGLYELARKQGTEAARQYMAGIANLKTHDFRLFLGNFRLHVKAFGIVALWYPKRQAQQSMF